MPRPKDPRLPALAHNIQQELDKRGWSASELARRIWGEVTTRNGRKAARNRAIISAILLKRSWPNSRTLKVIADAFGVTVAELTRCPAARLSRFAFKWKARSESGTAPRFHWSRMTINAPSSASTSCCRWMLR